jgi:hypothetical protein
MQVKYASTLDVPSSRLITRAPSSEDTIIASGTLKAARPPAGIDRFLQ